MIVDAIHGPDILNLWMDLVASHLTRRTIRTILDLGCGTGRFSEALAVRFNVNVIGVDPSSQMLQQARNKRHDQRLRYVQGCGENIPLADKSVNVIFMSMVFHHLENPIRATLECRRVLREGGTIFLRAGTRERIASYPYVDFFPESRPILEECLADSTSMRGVFETAGLRTIAMDVVIQEVAPDHGAYAEKLSAGADSILARLSASEFRSGMNALRLHAARNDHQSVSEPIDVFVFRR